MNIQVGEKTFELNTKLGTAVAIEKEFKSPTMKIFSNLNDAMADELMKIISIAAGQKENVAFRQELLKEWDLADMYIVVQELVARIMFSGTPEENELKLSKLPMGDIEKNAVRKLLGLPLPMEPEAQPEASTGSES